VSKAATTQHILKSLKEWNLDPDFVLCFGDDRQDEDMFDAAKEYADATAEVVTCTVGRKTSKAECFVEGVEEVIRALEWLGRFV